MSATLFALALSLTNPVHAAAPVEWLGGDGWISAYYTAASGRRGCDVSTWIDYTLWNWSYEKDTGIVWTTDDWATVNTAGSKALTERVIMACRAKTSSAATGIGSTAI